MYWPYKRNAEPRLHVPFDRQQKTHGSFHASWSSDSDQNSIWNAKHIAQQEWGHSHTYTFREATEHCSKQMYVPAGAAMPRTFTSPFLFTMGHSEQKLFDAPDIKPTTYSTFISKVKSGKEKKTNRVRMAQRRSVTFKRSRLFSPIKIVKLNCCSRWQHERCWEAARIDSRCCCHCWAAPMRLYISYISKFQLTAPASQFLVATKWKNFLGKSVRISCAPSETWCERHEMKLYLIFCRWKFNTFN